MSGLALEINDLHKTYRTVGGKQVALRGLNMHVERGKVYGFVGPNGAGKSTTIKILVGLVRPSAGSATVMGHPAGSVEARRLVGFLPEVALYHEFMGAEELLSIHAALAGVAARHRPVRCKEALELVGLYDRRKSRIKEFSKGMKQRFGIAQAIVGEPPLLILDELTSGLDPVAQRELKDLILSLKERGITIFFSSHQMSEVETVCDAIGVIHKGLLKAEGTLHDLLKLENQVEIHFHPAPEQDLGAVSELGSVREVRKGESALTVDSSRTDEAVDAVRKGGGSILSVQPAHRNLEDVFHQLVQAPEQESAA